MFRSLGKEERRAAFSLCVLNLPFEKSADVDVTDEERRSWNVSCLIAVAEAMRVDANGYYGRLSPNGVSFDFYMSNYNERMAMAQTCRNVLQAADLNELTMAAYLLVELVELKKFDSGGSVMLRNTVHCLGLSSQDFVWLVRQLGLLLLQQHEQMSHNPEQTVDQYRYAKIGAVALGAGALVFLTAGLAAPVLAGGLVFLGSSSAAAAGISGVTVVLFGGAGAGLAGYKMNTRTTGLTDFHFQQYDTPGKMEVIIMVSGWMEEDEDDKRIFGVPPENMSVKERLSRYYKIHDPDRLNKVDNEAACFADDPDQLYEQIHVQYGADPLDPANLMPSEPQPPSDPSSGASNRYLDILARCIERLTAATAEGTPVCELAPISELELSRHTSAPKAETVSESPGSAAEDVAAAATAATAAELYFHDEEDGDSDAGLVVVAVPVSDEATVEVALDVQPVGTAAGDEASAIHLSDTFQYWHWRELNVSPLYELTLLHWEAELQRNLGSTILNIAKLLADYEAVTSERFTVFSALAAAAATPVLLMQLTIAIDNVWLIAAERAEAAGKEMAKALLQRPHGSRPVTLVGYSMGARVIFSCLKELAKKLRELEEPTTSASSDVASTKSNTGARTRAGAGAGGVASAEGEASLSTAPSKEPATETSASAGTAQTGSSSFFSFGGMFSSSASGKASTTGDAADPTAAPPASPVPPASQRDQATGDSSSGVQTVRELRGLVKDVVLLGAPISLQSKYWAEVRRVVAGRLVNGYSTEDMLLSIVYRLERYKVSVSGVAPVPIVGVENIDLTHIATQHTHYCTNMKEILEEINLAGTSALSHDPVGV